jgi:integrase/recombinase XerD
MTERRKVRPVKRLKSEYVAGSGKAQIAETPSQLSSIVWRASLTAEAKRNVAMCLFLFGSGLRINELAQLRIKDVLYPNGELKTTFKLPARYTKTNKSRIVYIAVKQLRIALDNWLDQRIAEGAMTSDNGSYRNLRPDSPLFLSKKGSWRKFAFNVKKYTVLDDKGKPASKETLVCSTLENLMRDIFKGAGLQGGSSHSGRRTLGSWLDRKGCTLEAIQSIMNHEDPETTLIYIEPWEKRIDQAFKTHLCCVKMPDKLM